MHVAKTIRARLVLSTALAGAVFASYDSQTAQAGSCIENPPASGNFVCSGPAVPGDTTQPLVGNTVTGTTDPGFGITTAAGPAIDISSNAGQSFIDLNASPIEGDTYGIKAENVGTGDLTIQVTGTVTGVNNSGISAFNATGGGALTISAASVNGGYTGIRAWNDGAGDLSVSTSGPVASTGALGFGIYAKNANGGALTIMAQDTVSSASEGGIYAVNQVGTSNLTISAAGVIGDQGGITAQNLGTGALSITATGAVTATAGDGVFAFNSGDGTDLTIAVTQVSGDDRGINAANNGTGDFSLTADGPVTGNQGDGIFAYNRGNNLTVSASSVSGGEDGIYAKNYGAGALAITATGTVTGSGGNGIDGRNYGTDLTIIASSVNGDTDAIYAKNNGTGALTITATGPLTSTTRDGVSARNAGADGTDLTIDVADVTADRNGIYARNYGTGTLAISAGAVSAGDNGIFARNDGKGGLAITTTGQVTGGSDAGIGAHNGNGGTLAITAMDAVSSTDGYGIQAYNEITGNDLTISATTVSGGYGGIYAKNLGTGDLSVTASGPITASAGIGIYAYGSGYGQNVIVSADSVDGEYGGIFAVNEGFGGLDITATGTVTGGMDGNGIFGQNSGTSLTINAVDVIGDGNGVAAQNFGSGALSVTAGTVTGTGNFGVYAKNYYSGTDLTISVAGAHGGETGIEAKNYGSGALSITAAGPVEGSSQVGIYGKNLVSDLTIEATDVSGGTYGIVAVNEGTGSLTVIATGIVTGTAIAGLAALNEGTDITISTKADVLGGELGIYANNHGTGAVSITSSGPVTGTAQAGLAAFNEGTDITISAAADVLGGQFGIYANNEGTGASSITTLGSVTGTTDAGIFAENDGTGLLSVTTAKETTVTGGTNGIIVRSDTSDAELAIASTVTGGSGTAIDATGIGGNTTLELQPGFNFDDDFVFANDGDDRNNLLVLSGPTGEATFNLATLDDGDNTPEGEEQFFGFQPIFLKEGDSNFLLTGTNALPFEEAGVSGGVLALDGANIVLADGVPFVIGPDGALAAIGAQTLDGDVQNFGSILLSNNGFDPIAGLDGDDDVLTITGDYTAGSDLYLDTFLNDGEVDITDELVVIGDTSGETNVFVTNTGGPGGLTGEGPTDGILVVEVGGSSDGDFVLSNDVVAGFFEYDLRQADG
ncbi:MAG: hypothetical protein AAF414_21620, partial [Pseudomonadota bacterium]